MPWCCRKYLPPTQAVHHDPLEVVSLSDSNIVCSSSSLEVIYLYVYIYIYLYVYIYIYLYAYIYIFMRIYISLCINIYTYIVQQSLLKLCELIARLWWLIDIFLQRTQTDATPGYGKLRAGYLCRHWNGIYARTWRETHWVFM